MSGRVVVGYAPTPAGYQALRYAIDRARELSAPLVVVRAVRHDLDVMATESWLETRVSVTADVAATFRDALGGVPRDVEVRVVVQPGSLDHVLTAVAKQSDQLIVLGGCARRRWLFAWSHRAMVGRCLRAAVCPVMIVPAPEMARQSSIARMERDIVVEVEQYLRDPLAVDSNGFTR